MSKGKKGEGQHCLGAEVSHSLSDGSCGISARHQSVRLPYVTAPPSPRAQRDCDACPATQTAERLRDGCVFAGAKIKLSGSKQDYTMLMMLENL